jgi:uncharacterized protein YjiS (DUF1127 family)
MNTAQGAIGLGRPTALTRPVSFKKYWHAFQDWRTGKKLRATLDELSDRELNDIGITRGEIAYVASNPSIEPRGIFTGSV